MSERGFGPEDVPAARRAVFDVAVEQASARVDPHEDFAGWVEVLWEELAELFGWAPGGAVVRSLGPARSRWQVVAALTGGALLARAPLICRSQLVACHPNPHLPPQGRLKSTP